MFNIKKLLLIDALKFIPREAKDLLRIAPRIAINFPEGRYLFKRLCQSQTLDGPTISCLESTIRS